MQNGNRQLTVFYVCALSLWAEGSPQINASTEQSPRPSGERVRVREHTAVVVIPFTLCSLLLCNDMTGERAGVAQSPPPRRPGLPAVNRRFAVPSAYSFRLIGYGRRQRPCKAALSAHPCASPRPAGNASAIYSRTRASLTALSHLESNFIASA